MSGFANALPVVLAAEGGYVNDPDDRGGRTNHGITEAVFHDYLRSVGAPIRPVREIRMDEVEAIYHTRYWVEAKCDALPWPASAVHFDMAVNSGVARAGMTLQEALRVKVDGILGPVTLAAMEGADGPALANDLLWLRVDFYRRIATGSQIKFLRGWLARLVHLREEVGLA